MVDLRPTMMRPPPPRSPAGRIVGLVLAVPALVLLVTGYLLPTLRTVLWSVQRVNPIRPERNRVVGADNYRSALDDGLAGDLAFAVQLALVPLVAALVVAPLLAWAAHHGGRATRWAVRGLLVLPLAVFAPVAVVVSRILAVDDYDRDLTPFVRSTFWLGSFAVTAALATTAFLAVLRRRDPTRRPWPALAVVAVIAAAAVLAAAVQEFTSAAVVRGGTTGTPAASMYGFAFMRLDFGTAAVYATAMLVVLLLLGTAVGLLTVLSGLRIEVDERREPAGPRSARRPVWALVAAAVVAVVLVVAWLANRRWLGGVTDTVHPFGSTDGILVRTWLPPLVSTTVGVVVAALAAVGISGLRPLGRHSEWLLMPFAPFLFVGVAPLAITGYDATRANRGLDTFLGAIPPTLLPVVVLFVLALLLRGQVLRRDALRQVGQVVPWTRTLLPALPMVGLAFVVTWVVQAQDLLWPWVATNDQWRTATRAVIDFAGGRAPFDVPYGLVMPVWLIPLLLLLGAVAQLLYLDRVALRVGRPERDHPPRT